MCNAIFKLTFFILYGEIFLENVGGRNEKN